MLDPPPYFLTHLNVKEPAMIARARVRLMEYHIAMKSTECHRCEIYVLPSLERPRWP
jgi:hypothetical protein